MPENQGSQTLSQENLICCGVLVAAVLLAAVLYPGLGSLSIWSSLIALGVGGILWGILHVVKSDYRMTFVEATVASVILLVVVVPLTDYLGSRIAFENKVTYKEYWGGFEASATVTTFDCYESTYEGWPTGGCTRTYNADSYEVDVTYEVEVVDREAYTDSDGHYHSEESHTETRCCHQETHYRQVPYTQHEYTWVVHTTVGDYVMGENWLDANPNAHRIRPERDSMDPIPSNLNSGTPQLWLAADKRLNAGNRGPVVAERDYANLILPSRDEALKAYSPYIGTYKASGLLPEINHSVRDFYYLDRAYFVGDTGANKAEWQEAVSRFDAALAELEGDAYIVIVDAHKVTDPDIYIKTLTAYWQSPEFDKYAISKNGIIVVLGTADGKTVEWARASTGMPTGNSKMVYAIQNIPQGTLLTPVSILGKPTASIDLVGDQYTVKIIHTQSDQGALESIMWGANGFKRVCMVCQGTNEVGYTYLKNQIQPTAGELCGILTVLFFLSCLIWGLCVFQGVPAYRNFTGFNPY